MWLTERSCHSGISASFAGCCHSHCARERARERESVRVAAAGLCHDVVITAGLAEAVQEEAVQEEAGAGGCEGALNLTLTLLARLDREDAQEAQRMQRRDEDRQPVEVDAGEDGLHGRHRERQREHPPEGDAGERVSHQHGAAGGVLLPPTPLSRRAPRSPKTAREDKNAPDTEPLGVVVGSMSRRSFTPLGRRLSAITTLLAARSEPQAQQQQQARQRRQQHGSSRAGQAPSAACDRKHRAPVRTRHHRSPAGARAGLCDT